MLKPLLSSLKTTAMAMAPFLLTACGDNGDSGQTRFEIVVLALLCCTVSLAQSWLKSDTRRLQFKA